MPKPRVLTKCFANTYSGPHERIVEFSSKNGGLISFKETDDNGLLVGIYRLDANVRVQVPNGAFAGGEVPSPQVSAIIQEAEAWLKSYSLRELRQTLRNILEIARAGTREPPAETA